MDIMKRLVSIIVFSFVLSSVINAQENSSDKEKITKIENILSKLPKISGLVNVRYRYDDLNNDNSFDIRRVRLTLQGDISKQIEYRFQAEFANNPKILDAYVNWKITDYLSFCAGQYKIPLSLENPYGPTNLEVIDNSLVISSLVGYSDVAGISANGRDIGIGFNGSFIKRKDFSIINYSLGLFNGAGINITDANKSKDFSGILTIKPFKDLSIAAYHYNGLAGRQDDTFKRVRTGFGAKYDNGKWLIRSEYINGKTGDFKSEGAYAVLGYFINKKIQTIVKYDYFKRDMSDNNTLQQDYTVGVNYFPVKNVRMQLNYAYKTTHEKNINYVAMQVVGIF